MTLTGRQIQLRRFLLLILNDAGDLMTPEDASLLTDLNLRCRPKATLTEMIQVLELMEARHQIARLQTDEGVKCKLTESGRADVLQG